MSMIKIFFSFCVIQTFVCSAVCNLNFVNYQPIKSYMFKKYLYGELFLMQTISVITDMYNVACSGSFSTTRPSLPVFGGGLNRFMYDCICHNLARNLIALIFHCRTAAEKNNNIEYFQIFNFNNFAKQIQNSYLKQCEQI